MGVPIEFKKVRFQNLFSYGNNVSEFDLSGNSLELIVGKSGAGKSTILDAICFGLFGKPYKKVNKGNIINSMNGKGTLVEIEFSVGPNEFKVVRGMKPSIFEIYRNGESLDHDAKVTDLQKSLEKNILGDINYNTFLQTAIIGSANFIPFMQLSSGARREVVESILSLSIFSVASDIAKKRLKKIVDDKNETFSNFRIIDTSISEKKKTVEILRHKMSNTSHLDAEKRLALKEAISAHETTILALLNDAKEIKVSVITQIEAAVDKAKISEMKNVGLDKTHKKKALLEKINLWDKGNCPTCGQELSKESNAVFDYASAEKEVSDINEFLIGLKKEVEQSEALWNDIDRQKREGMSILQKIDLEKTKKQGKIDQLSALDSKKEEEFDEEAVNSVLTEIESLEDKRLELSNMMSELDSEIIHIKMAVEMFKDSGIKSSIVKLFLPLINQYMNEYLEEFELSIKFEFDENFDEKITGPGSDDYSYNNFSEGEKKRIDLAVLFSWLKIAAIKNSANMNILCCDELMDGSLDYDSIHNLVKILRKFIDEEGKSVFIISHRQELKEAFFDKIHNVRKDGPFSFIEEIIE